MKLSSFAKLTVLGALLVSLNSGCTTTTTTASHCPQKYSQHYADTARGFTLCLPAGVHSTASGATVTFTGFAVPAGTNLEAKTLVIVPGNYHFLQGATPSGSITANGVVLQRVQLDDGSAGHSTRHIIYTWKQGAKIVHFDFTHRSVNVDNFDPQNRPQEYDRTAQLKITEEIMSTFKRLP